MEFGMSDTNQLSTKSAVQSESFGDGLALLGDLFSATQAYLTGMAKYTADFYIPYSSGQSVLSAG